MPGARRHVAASRRFSPAVTAGRSVGSPGACWTAAADTWRLSRSRRASVAGAWGRALLLHALTDLQQAGARGLTLGVEADNESALGLYRSVGMAVEREWRIYATAPKASGPLNP